VTSSETIRLNSFKSTLKNGMKKIWNLIDRTCGVWAYWNYNKYKTYHYNKNSKFQYTSESLCKSCNRYSLIIFTIIIVIKLHFNFNSIKQNSKQPLKNP